MVFGVIALMGYQLVDSIFISLLGTAPLAALGFTVAVNQVLIGVQIGIGIATTALISRALGARQLRRARSLGVLVMIAGSSLMAMLCLAAWWLRDPILRLLDAETALWPEIAAYWPPWLASVWLGAGLYFAYSVARAHGNTRTPGTVMVITSLLNLVLDPLFIFVFGWGLPGAAYATLAAFAVGGLIMVPRVRRARWLRYRRDSLPIMRALGELAAISGPAMLSQLMPGMAAVAATSIVAGFGAPAVAAWALNTRLEFFSIVIVLALTMSLPPMVGRFLGAGAHQDIHQLLRLAARFVLALQLGIALLWLSLAWVLPTALSSDAQVAAYLRLWFISVPFSFGSLGVCMLMVSAANALGMPVRAVVISMLRLFAFYLPALWLGARMAGMTGIYLGVLGGNLLAGLVAWHMVRRALRRLETADSRTPTS